MKKTRSLRDLFTILFEVFKLHSRRFYSLYNKGKHIRALYPIVLKKSDFSTDSGLNALLVLLPIIA